MPQCYDCQRTVEIQLHTFVDGREEAFAATVYLRHQRENRKHKNEIDCCNVARGETFDRIGQQVEDQVTRSNKKITRITIEIEQKLANVTSTSFRMPQCYDCQRTVEIQLYIRRWKRSVRRDRISPSSTRKSKT
ncbi:hypothetical protein EVAR_66715_1 [Eumeta japonica]|uniref:Uncharacterized protein n=1 Tax=Eumeta variegata TaxID=151549 RepID=A0A4C1ZT66_EUMVA|nr:hypothetical protein EVAR_66715_1 [Eumeta japonica]